MADTQPELASAIQTLLGRRPQRLIFSSPRGGYTRAALRPVGGGWQLEKHTETQVFHTNLAEGELPAAIEALLRQDFSQLTALSPEGESRLRLTAKGRVQASHSGKGATDAGAAANTEAAPAPHNRQKRTLLPQGAPSPALIEMGVFTPDGRVVKGKQDKYRQVNRYLELVDHLLGAAHPAALSVVDFGCGKGTLTFLLYQYLTQTKGIAARVTGVDQKTAVMEKCNAAAQKHGYEGLEFVAGDIGDHAPEQPPDMVVSLHACDTATDLALAKAVGWGSRYIFCAPCCQKELNGQMQPKELALLARYGVVKERAAALMTDAIRAGLLTACGYKTQLLEFVDLSHTPKNLLIRAEATGQPLAVRRQAMAEVESLCEAFTFQPSLLHMLREMGRLPGESFKVNR